MLGLRKWICIALILELLGSTLPALALPASTGREDVGELFMNDFPVLPQAAQKRIELQGSNPEASADLSVFDFFQLIGSILNITVVMPEDTRLKQLKVGIVLRDMSIEQSVQLVLQYHRLRAVHFNENTLFVVSQTGSADYGFKTSRSFRLRYTNVLEVVKYLTLNRNALNRLQNVTYTPETNTLIAFDTEENLRLLGYIISKLDVPPIKILEAVKLSYIDNTQFRALYGTLGREVVERMNNIGVSYNKDARALMVYGTPEDVRFVRNLVDKFDVAPKQVLIDTSFLQVSESFNREFGFKFTNNSITVNQFDRIKDIDRVRAQLAGPPAAFPTRTQINYLISKTGAKTLQSPKVRTIDNAPATINIGEIRNIQIQSTATTLGTGLTPGQQQTTFNTQEVPIGVQVNVTPQIHNDDSVTLDMKISVTKVLEIKSFGVDRTTQDSTTKLRIRNGETVVLGGFINQVLNSDDTPIPFLGEVPLFDKIFRNKKRERTDSELVFLLTPYILDFQDRTPRPDVYNVAADGAHSEPATTTQTAAKTSMAPVEISSSAMASAALPKPAPGGVHEPATRLSPEPMLELGKPVGVVVHTTRVVENKSGSARVVFDGKGKVVSHEFTPNYSAVARPAKIAVAKVAAVQEEDSDDDEAASVPVAAHKTPAPRRVVAVAQRSLAAAGDDAPRQGVGDSASALDAVVQQHRAAQQRAGMASATAGAEAGGRKSRPEEGLSARDLSNLKRIADLAKAAPAEARPRKVQLPPAELATQIVRPAATKPLDPTERLSRLARGARSQGKQYRAVTAVRVQPATDPHELLRKLREERAREQAGTAEATNAHPFLEKLRRERLQEQAKKGTPTLHGPGPSDEMADAAQQEAEASSAGVGPGAAGKSRRVRVSAPTARAIRAEPAEKDELAEEPSTDETGGPTKKPAKAEAASVSKHASQARSARPLAAPPIPTDREILERLRKLSAPVEAKAEGRPWAPDARPAVLEPRPWSGSAKATARAQIFAEVPAANSSVRAESARAPRRVMNRLPAVTATAAVSRHVAARDEALIARLGALSKESPSPNARPALPQDETVQRESPAVTVGEPDDERESVATATAAPARPEPKRELQSGSSFEDLARAAERDLGSL